jgi:hypothetical protein
MPGPILWTATRWAEFKDLPIRKPVGLPDWRAEMVRGKPGLVSRQGPANKSTRKSFVSARRFCKQHLARCMQREPLARIRARVRGRGRLQRDAAVSSPMLTCPAPQPSARPLIFVAL